VQNRHRARSRHQLIDSRSVDDVNFLDVDRLAMNALEIGLFPGAIVEVAEVIDADHAVPALKKCLSRVRADKPRRSRDENVLPGHREKSKKWSKE
jgi:hypothetical protein